jgi:hypothetical protein
MHHAFRDSQLLGKIRIICSHSEPVLGIDQHKLVAFVQVQTRGYTLRDSDRKRVAGCGYFQSCHGRNVHMYVLRASVILQRVIYPE